MKAINSIVKRLFDFVLSLIGIIVLSPILLVVSIVIKLDSAGPVLFKQVRVGKNKKDFKILKFRTMVPNADKIGKEITVEGDSRITKVGNFLRKYKLDELPQLINVLKGDMSLVGPRPEVPRYVKLYTDKEKEVFKVRPGITDLASIKYRDENGILAGVKDPEKYYIDVILRDKLSINIEYINNNNIFKDIGIIFSTIKKCL